MDKNIEFILFANGLGFYADCDGVHIGEITFLRVGIDKLVIEHTNINAKYQKSNIGLNLVRHVCAIARAQHRKIIAMCPFAKSIFYRYSEFDDVRLINAH